MNRCKYIASLLLLSLRLTNGSIEIKVPKSPTDGVSDPGGVLTPQQHQKFADRINDFQIYVPNGVDRRSSEVQIAVAVVDRMNFDSEVDGEEAAEKVAVTLHDTWGVGEETDAGGTGILVFLSIFDRIVFISRGEALKKVLTDARIDSILQNIGPSMTQTKFSEGLMMAIDDVEHFILKGEPTWKETILNFLCIANFFLATWVAVLLHSITRASRRRRQQRAYAEAALQLSEIDRAQAQALQGRFQATSCPICLESSKDSDTGSDDQPIRLLRCGHVFDEECYSQWIAGGRGNIRHCPICKMDVGQPYEERHTDNQTMPLVDNSAMAAGEGDTDVAVRRFQQDRNFRLVRLGMRFPNVITQSQIQRWSSPTYDSSLARDPEFRQRSPEEEARRSQMRREALARGTFSRHSVSYGGGTSAGGRAGRF